ncbi:MAG: DegV family EDD domain-containing protein [Anaerolineales bacterium]|nr:DegV family EDD domain-containing protein [Anaerolineales bacterium]
MSERNLSTVAVVTDSTADIPKETQEELQISVVPALVMLNGDSYLDGIELSRSEFYSRLPEFSTPPSTAAPSMQTFEDTYERLLSKGFEKVVSIHLPSTLSAILDVATQAAISFGDRVHPFDSGQVSLGMGFQVIESALEAIKGASLHDVMDVAKRTRENVRLIALIDSLEYLKRSGRVGWLSAGLGDFLHIKILLELSDGEVNRLGQVRTRSRAKTQLREIAETWGALDRLAVAHSAVPEEAEDLATNIADFCPTPPLVIEVTTAIGAHIGPGALGIIGLKQAS